MTTTFEQVKARWQRHNCPSESSICDCSFDFYCESCGDAIKTVGESMDFLIGIGGLCENCLYKPVLLPAEQGRDETAAQFVREPAHDHSVAAGYTMAAWCWFDTMDQKRRYYDPGFDPNR